MFKEVVVKSCLMKSRLTSGKIILQTKKNSGEEREKTEKNEWYQRESEHGSEIEKDKVRQSQFKVVHIRTGRTNMSHR